MLLTEVFPTDLGSNPTFTTTSQVIMGSLLSLPDQQFPHLQNSNNYPISQDNGVYMRHQWKILAHKRYAKNADFLPDLGYKGDDT